MAGRGRPLKCTCGECRTCQRRIYMREYLARPEVRERVNADRRRPARMRDRLVALEAALQAAEQELAERGCHHFHPVRVQARQALRLGTRYPKDVAA